MIHKIDKGKYYVIVADSGMFTINGGKKIYTHATEYKDKPRKYEEVLPNALW